MAAVKVWYDQEGDYLEVLFADEPAVLEEIDDDVFVAVRTPQTDTDCVFHKSLLG